jgi:hypothetical protein
VFAIIEREAILHLTKRLQDQFLHPRTAVNSAVTRPHHVPPHPLRDADRHLFGLNSLKKIGSLPLPQLEPAPSPWTVSR